MTAKTRERGDPMLISELVKTDAFELISGSGDIDIDSVEFDSRACKPGSLFVAIKGFNSDGHEYIGSAAAKGVSAVLIDSSRDKERYGIDDILKTLGPDTAVIETRDTRKALGIVSAEVYDHPERKLDIAGITGTKGKTTITFMLRSILDCAGISSGLVGTVRNIAGGKIIKSEHTTPESSDLYRMMRDMEASGDKALVMEVSSQGLKFDRAYGVRYKVAAFTNLYEDHIAPTEHPDMEDYFASKLKIFDNCQTGIINGDSSYAADAAEYASGKCDVLFYGTDGNVDIKASGIRHFSEGCDSGSVFELASPWYQGEIKINLPGKFNVSNALCAIACAGVMGIPFDSVREGLAKARVPGRMQPVANDLGISVIVDYAHNAAALENVLLTVREYTDKRIICVFGCGGNRSRTRRFEMGEVSGRMADLTVITSDNPRNEDPLAIIEDIVTGIEPTGGVYETEPDRARAIKHAMSIANPGDVVIIAGKGHEDYQIFADRTIHFDDGEAASAAAAEIKEERQ